MGKLGKKVPLEERLLILKERVQDLDEKLAAQEKLHIEEPSPKVKEKTYALRRQYHSAKFELRSVEKMLEQNK